MQDIHRAEYRERAHNLLVLSSNHSSQTRVFTSPALCPSVWGVWRPDSLTHWPWLINSPPSAPLPFPESRAPSSWDELSVSSVMITVFVLKIENNRKYSSASQEMRVTVFISGSFIFIISVYSGLPWNCVCHDGMTTYVPAIEIESVNTNVI